MADCINQTLGRCQTQIMLSAAGIGRLLCGQSATPRTSRRLSSMSPQQHILQHGNSRRQQWVMASGGGFRPPPGMTGQCECSADVMMTQCMTQTCMRVSEITPS